MAKIARRSVASNPSSLTYSSSLSSSSSFLSTKSSSHNLRAVSGGNSYQQKPSAIKNPSALPATPDPLRTTNYQLTTRTVSKYNRNGNVPTTQTASSTHRNENKNFGIINTNSSKNSTDRQNFNSTTAADVLAAERERIKMEFYATYDVMTGVRIAATLGGFFGLMVFLIVYKSRSHSNETLKVLKDPKIAAVAAACMQEEEEREIQEAIEATGLSIYPDEYESMMFRRQRMLSLGNVSAPPVLHRGFRFSSIGGGAYSSLLEPGVGRRFSYSSSRRRSGSESSRVLTAYPMGSSFGTDDYFVETDDELENEYDALSTRDRRSNTIHVQQGFLGVPAAGPESRRSSAMTCCSTESSYLERRCSALSLGLMELPANLQRKISSASRRYSTDIWDYYYPDIQVIQPTPKTSPCLSERSVHENVKNSSTGTSTYAKSSITPTSTTSSYSYGQSNKIFPKTDDNYRCHDSFVEKRKVGHTLSADGHDQKTLSRKYDDNNELKLIVERKISDPSSIINNNNSYSNICTSSYDSLQFRNNGDVKRAPLASLSSFKISSIDYQDSDLKSLRSDSIFVESYADTDDDMEQFSTDSDELSGSLCDDEPVKSLHSQHTSNLPLPTLQKKLDDSSQSQKQQISTRSDPCPLKADDSRKPSFSSTGSSKRFRSTLDRHRTVSTSSNDRILLISQQFSQDHTQPPESSDLEYFDRRELPTFTSSGYTPSTSSVTHQLPTSKAGSTTSSLQTGTGTGTGTLSSSNKTEIHRPSTLTSRNVARTSPSSFSYDNNNDSCNSNRSSSKRYSRNDDKSESKLSTSSNNSNNECVEVNVIIENRPTNVVSPSVILELPVITVPSQVEDDPPRDPSLPGTSRKWSKETLF